MNELLITTVNTALVQGLPSPDKIQAVGLLTESYSPGDKARVYLLDSDTTKRYCLDTRYTLQLAHLLGDAQRVSAPAFGTRSQVRFNLRLLLICATTRDGMLSELLRRLEGLSQLRVTGFERNTLDVLARYFLFRPGPNVPFQPRMKAFAISYELLDVDLENL